MAINFRPLCVKKKNVANEALFLQRCRKAPRSFFRRRASRPAKSCFCWVCWGTSNPPPNFLSKEISASAIRKPLGTCQFKKARKFPNPLHGSISLCNYVKSTVMGLEWIFLADRAKPAKVDRDFLHARVVKENWAHPRKQF